MVVKLRTGIENANKVVREALEGAIRDSGEIGLQVAAYLDGELAVDVWSGLADETTGWAVDENTIFPTFSMAKPVTSVALHIQAEQGLVDYDTPVAHYWPEFGAHGKDRATLRHALGHRLGIPFMPEGVTVEQLIDFDWVCRALADMVPVVEPGTLPSYMSFTFGWPVAEVVRRTDPKGRPYPTFIQEEISQPLGIDDGLWIGVPADQEFRVAKLTNAAPPDEDGPLGPPGRRTSERFPPGGMQAGGLRTVRGEEGLHTWGKRDDDRPKRGAVLLHAGPGRRARRSAPPLERARGLLQRAGPAPPIRPRSDLLEYLALPRLRRPKDQRSRAAAARPALWEQPAHPVARRRGQLRWLGRPRLPAGRGHLAQPDVLRRFPRETPVPAHSQGHP